LAIPSKSALASLAIYPRRGTPTLKYKPKASYGLFCYSAPA